MVVRASSGNVVTSVGSSAPGSSGNEGQTTSAVVVGGATGGDGNASVANSAPGLSSGADTLSGKTIVAGGSRAEDWEGVASVGQGAEAGVGLVGQTITAVVIGSTTAGDEDAGTSDRTPSESS